MTLSLCVIPSSAKAEIKLNKTSVNLPMGYKTTIKLTGTNKIAKWDTNDRSKVKLIPDGNTVVVKGLMNGEVIVYAELDGVDYDCTVKVDKGFITLGKTSVNVDKGKSAAVNMKVVGSHKIAYKVGNKNIASVSFGKWDGNNIKVTVKGKRAGTTAIKLYIKGYISTVKTIYVTVQEKSTGTGKSVAEQLDEQEKGQHIMVFDDNFYDDDEDYGKPQDETAMRDKVFKLVNEARAAEGVKALNRDPELDAAANIRAKEIATKFSHTRPDGRGAETVLKDNGVAFEVMGENVAANGKTAKAVMKMWKSSPGHWGNIMATYYDNIGIGLYIDDDGICYWVQIFTR